MSQHLFISPFCHRFHRELSQTAPLRTIMQPRKSITVRLVEVQVLNNSPSPALGHAPKNVPPKIVSVLHLSNRARYSFIAEPLAKQLLKTNYGSRASAFKIDNGTLIILEWRYPDLKHTEVTTHLVVRDSPFQIVLRKQDWEMPIRFWLMGCAEQELRGYGILQTYQKKVGMSPNKAEIPQCGDASESVAGALEITPERDSDKDSVVSESSINQSTSSRATTVSEGEVGGDEQGNEEAGSETGQLDSESEWPDIEIVSTKSEDSDTDNEEQADAYWTWSPEQHRWFHENEDKSLAWFPPLVSQCFKHPMS
ncbi:hypothetical protein BKA56DRAFT_600847 [Ilyonectria sp. MPI-CAGE-AT-0026]|nr:hypothetical protein BKA56DRAFT_600847 [Ilyonectria sp. MPI-CAGE-AT-0026]